MKKFIILSLLAFLSFAAPAQRVSLTETAKTVQELEKENEALQMQVVTIEKRLNTIEVNVDSIYQEGKESLKVPTNVEEAEGLWAFLSSIVVWLFTGVLSKYKPVWLSNFVLSLIIASVVSAIAYFGSNGAFTFAEIIEFLVIASGGSNILHQIKKPQPEPTPETVTA